MIWTKQEPKDKEAKATARFVLTAWPAHRSGFVANNVDFIFMCTFELGYFKAKSLPFSSFKSNDNA